MAFSTAALIFSSAFCSLSFVCWGPDQRFRNSTGCSMEAVFSENMGSSMKVFWGTFLLPLLLTNFLYASLFFMIRHKQRQIQPASHTSIHRGVASIVKMSTKKQFIQGGGVVSTLNQVQSPRAGLANLNTSRQDKLTPKTDAQNTCISQTTSDLEHKIDLTSPVGHTKVKQSNANTAKSTSNSDAERRIYQTKAFTLIGMILLFLNVCTWPSVIVLMMGSIIDEWSLSRGTTVPLFCSLSSNAVINPILYTVRLQEFRTVLSDVFLCSHSRMR